MYALGRKRRIRAALTEQTPWLAKNNSAVRECAEDDGHKGHIFRIISHGPRRYFAERWQERYPLGEKGGEGKEPQGRVELPWRATPEGEYFWQSSTKLAASLLSALDVDLVDEIIRPNYTEFSDA